MSHRGLVLTLFVLPALVTADTQSPAAIPIVVDMDGRIAVTVRINGAGSFRFRIDTGASRTVVSTAVAADLGLPPVGESRTITHTGESVHPLVRADDLAVGSTGDLRAKGLAVLVLRPEDIDRTGRIHGILGQDVLSRWIYTIDYRARQLLLQFDTPAGRSRAVRLPLVRSAGGLMAAITLGGRSEPLNLIPDSGADRLVLFGQPSDGLPSQSLVERVRVRSITGDAGARLVRLDRLEIGGIAVGDHQALLLDQRPLVEAMGDGLLPLHLFGRVTFDVAGSSLWLEPRH
jgi:predicted aspartyl protease